MHPKLSGAALFKLLVKSQVNKYQIKLFLLKNQSKNKPNKTVMIFDWSTFNVTKSEISLNRKIRLD
jgi:hypothetical protein